ncbi:hypothetical protein ONS95_010274 [Cadophora gregata]|uniref:uncharacterized protein n=1 Tax=Cadophora gregata TaxID=51156 RepID=UPI0026DC524A|nr:uncharacterized protein ONS95_010274 [Cadophora gregata]KAK0122009.1 hypothetical protein ONS95_010274 [Cadophora gregata]
MAKIEVLKSVDLNNEASEAGIAGGGFRNTEQRSRPCSGSRTFALSPLLSNARTLNADTQNNLLSETQATNHQYIIALMLFLVAYAMFDAPSNYLLKKKKPSPSIWTSFLMFLWYDVFI